ASMMGSGAYLLGVALLYGTYGTVSLPHLGELMTHEVAATVPYAAGLMLAGLLLKTALFPLHFWLPPAHGGAPAPVSALLSALVIKASRSEEHTSELQSRENLVCRLLLEKKNKQQHVSA